ncbi:hypothetical protein ACHAXS_009469, partial [Conticribra weissflogii]
MRIYMVITTSFFAGRREVLEAVNCMETRRRNESRPEWNQGLNWAIISSTSLDFRFAKILNIIIHYW